MTHRELCFDLANAKGTLYIEIPLGPVWGYIKRRMGLETLGRADVITIKPSYTKFNLDIYECKVTRSDFLSDINSKKYEIYYNHCHRFYFAALSGIIKASEIPDGIGLIVRGETGWKTIKQAKKREVNIPESTLLAIAFYKGRVYNLRRGKVELNYNWKSGKDRYNGLSRHIRDSLIKYDKVNLALSNLVWDIASKHADDYENIRKWYDKWYIDNELSEIET